MAAHDLRVRRARKLRKTRGTHAVQARSKRGPQRAGPRDGGALAPVPAASDTSTHEMTSAQPQGPPGGAAGAGEVLVPASLAQPQPQRGVAADVSSCPRVQRVLVSPAYRLGEQVEQLRARRRATTSGTPCQATQAHTHALAPRTARRCTYSRVGRYREGMSGGSHALALRAAS